MNSVSPHFRLRGRSALIGPLGKLAFSSGHAAGAPKLASAFPDSMAIAKPPCRVASCLRNSFSTPEKLCPSYECCVSGEDAIEAASDCAFSAAYLESKVAISAVSCRTSSTGVENHLSIERFIKQYENPTITITGVNESSKLPTT